MTHSEDLLKLLDRISSGEATDADIRRYNHWCNTFQANGLPVPNVEEIKAEMLMEVRKQIRHNVKTYRLRLWTKVAAAASIVLALAFGGYYLLQKPASPKIAHKQSIDIVPGSNKAVLTLANGQTIILDSVHNGQLTRQGNSKVTKINSGLLVYQAKSQKLSSKSPVTFNTLHVPRGGQYQLILPDGTKVWLNAASSIRYPTAFTGKNRKVAITGEAYMEVAKDVLHPFIVTTRHSDITVLGTHFNVMAYDNAPAVRTTLLEGAVKITVPGAQKAIRITPGEQAIVSNTSEEIKVKKVHATDAAAWIHGFLSMKDCSVPEFMNQLSRWYDVDVEYAGKVPRQKFGGLINRNTRLSNVLSALDAAGIHTKLEGKKMIVLSH